MAFFNHLRPIVDCTSSPPSSSHLPSELNPFQEDVTHYLAFRFPQLQTIIGYQFKDSNWAYLAACGPTYLTRHSSTLSSILPMDKKFIGHWAPRLQSVYSTGQAILGLVLQIRHQTNPCNPSSFESARYLLFKFVCSHFLRFLLVIILFLLVLVITLSC